MEPANSQGLPNDVLIVEDDAIIALDFEDTLLGFGVKTVRSCGSVVRALKLIADRPPDFVLLDVALVSERSFAVAERLQAMKIPFVFITGYSRDFGLPPAFAGTPMLPKPCTSDVLEAALRQRARRE
jgi:two-component SAPR family response regulator